MKITFTTYEQGSEIKKSLDLCGQGRPEGSADGLVPLKLTKDVTVTPRVTVYTSTSTTRSKAISAVVKVSMPYTALKLSEDGLTVVGVDPSRSGAEFSIHTVVALPAAMRADLMGANGNAMQLNALRQLLVLTVLHSSLVSDRFQNPGPAVAVDGAGGFSAADHYERVLGGTSTLFKTIAPGDLLGSTGFDVSNVTPDSLALNEPLNRMIAGMPPLGCGDVARTGIIVPA